MVLDADVQDDNGEGVIEEKIVRRLDYITPERGGEEGQVCWT